VSDRVLLVDGNNVALRALHAGAHAGMTNHTGRNTSAAVIFLNMITKAVRQSNPTHVRVLWDTGRSVLRTALYPQYKASREVPQEEREQYLGEMRTLVTLLNLPYASATGVEADDLIAVAQRTARETLHEPTIVIFSGDKDLLQLVGPDTEQIRPGVSPEVWHSEQVIGKFGVGPEMFASYLALVGDSGDNVPGVRGLGPKRAQAILEGATTFQDVLDRLDSRQQIEAILSHSLVCLNDIKHQDAMELVPNVHEPLHPWEPTTPGSPLWISLQSFLQSLDIRVVLDGLNDGSIWRPPDALL
jgi:DNA polymerase-1